MYDYFYSWLLKRAAWDKYLFQHVQLPTSIYLKNYRPLVCNYTFSRPTSGGSLYTWHIGHILQITELTVDSSYKGTFSHSATIILVPEKWLLSVWDRMKPLTALICEKSEVVNSVYVTDPTLVVSISAANGATTEYELGPGKSSRDL